MADPLVPTQQPYFINEWTFSNTTAPPPTFGQIRLNSGGQTNATLIYAHKTTVNSNDASSWLTSLGPGQIVMLRDKTDPTKWQQFLVTGPSVAKTDYWEVPITWMSGGAVLAQQRVYFENPGIQVSVTGTAATVSGGAVTVDLSRHVRIDVTGNEMQALAGVIDIQGQLVTREFAYPFQGKYYSSPGMTLRQYYVGQAITGFLASGGPIGNLIGVGAELCFRVADSMIAFEAKMAGPPRIASTPQVPAPPTGVSTPPGQANITVPIEEALAMQARDAAE